MAPFGNFMCTDAQLPHVFGIWLNTGQFLMRSMRSQAVLFWALLSYPICVSQHQVWTSETQVKLHKMSHWHPKIRPGTICIKMMGIILSGCSLNQANFRQLEMINVNVISFLAKKQSSTCLNLVYTLKSSRVRCKGQCPLVEWLL